MEIITTDIQRPDQDDRSYSLLRLSNKLEALIISDPFTDKASAALDVHVGSLSDPEHVDGLAHFLEHLLFMGTTKYPIENDYSHFLSVHGGHSNAFTAGDHTNFYFDVASDHLEPALDRFSQFFISPLFLESCTDRELHAVDSEHKKNMQSDAWRSYQVVKNLSDPNHPFSRFGTGNLHSLRDIPLAKGLNIRKVLIDFYNRYYSANIMKLVVLGKESVDELTRMVVEKFQGIKNMDISVPRFSHHVLSPELLTTTVMLKPVKDAKQITLMFPLKDYREHYRTHPLQYISHLIGHEGPGSILSLLKTKGLAYSLMASSSGFGSIGFEFFRLVIDMTEKGLAHFNEIIKIIFQYIQLLKQKGALEWVFHECQAISRMSFRFKEKASPSNYTSSLAGNMHHFAPREVISGPYLVEDFNKELIESCFDYLTPGNMQVLLVASAFEPNEEWESCPWYGSRYKVVPMDSTLKRELESMQIDQELRLPDPNEFIAENFTVSHTKSEVPKLSPSLVMETPLVRLWHKQDDTFMVPKSNVYFEVRTPVAYQNVENCMLTRLYSDLLKDTLNEFAYFAEVAGLAFNLENSTDGILLSVYGYNDKLHVLLSEISAKMASFPIDEFHFHRVKDATSRKLKGWFHDSPYTHATYYMSGFTQEKLFTTQQKLTAIEPITLDNVKSFYRSLFDHCHIQCLVHGNMDIKVAFTNQEAKSICKIFVNALQPQPLPSPPPEMRIHMVPTGKSIVYSRDAFDENNPNSAIEYCIQVGSAADLRIRCLVNLVSQIIYEPGFDQLRTKEQLGYSVYVGVRNQIEMISLRVIIQSTHHPVYLEYRIEEFLKIASNLISSLTSEQFRKHQKALVSKLKEKPKNMGHESARIWSHVTSRYYDFEQNQKDADFIETITHPELVEFFKSFILTPSHRRKLSVHIVSKKCNHEYTAEQQEAMELVVSQSDLIEESQVKEYQSKLELTREPQPAVPLSSFLILS